MALQYAPWEAQYLDYSKLKAVLETQTTKELAAFREREFVRQLNREIEKIVLFFLEEQGQLAYRLSTLREQERECSLQVRELATHGGKEEVILTKLNELSEQYTAVGEDLVHLIHFVELNVTGVRKILKKHDKLYRGNQLSDRYLSEHYWETEDSHLRQLLHYEGIGAIVATLQESLTEIGALERILQDSITRSETADSRHRRRSTAPGPLFMSAPESAKPWKPATPQTATKQLASSDTVQEYLTDLSSLELPILWRINAARRRLRESSNFVQVMAAGEMALMERVSSEEDFEAIEAAFPHPRVSRISSFLNLMSTFLYMTNYYIVAPTSGRYASKLGGNAALAGLIIGMTPIAALVSTVLYSWWTSHSYKAALIFASTCSIVGNVLYALGLPCNNLMLLMVGRLLNGFGSARSINRRYIADAFPREERTAASATFVTAGALGMAAGPAIAAILDLSPSDGIWWSPENAPGWSMAVAWCVYLVVLVLNFQDPPRLDDAPNKAPKDVEMVGEKRALLATFQEEETETVPPPLWMNIPVMTTLFIYFVIKLALECILSSTATLTDYYFGWGAQASGIYLAIMGLLMFPANLLVAYFSRQHEDRELIVGGLWLLLVGVCGIVNYGSPDSYKLIQFITFGVVIFVSANALEGPNMSLLSKTIPRSWAKGLFNVGLLATEAGTLGRAVGDVFITWCGLDSISHLLNNMFISLGIVVGLTLAGTYKAYSFLEPYDKDD
jgi:predicted MFS family arabinose efflux permease